MHKFPVLYHQGKSGEVWTWEVWADGDQVHTLHGLKDGAKTPSCKVVKGVNVGKANETTAQEQAVLKAQSMWNEKRDSKYSESEEEACKPAKLPMLAKDYNEKKAVFPAMLQPKLDGVRCLAVWEGDEVKLLSKTGKVWTKLKCIADRIAQIMPKDWEFDGEVYLHGKTMSQIVKMITHNPEDLEFHIFDAPIVAGSFTLTNYSRSRSLMDLFKGQQDKVKDCQLVLVNTALVDDSKEAWELAAGLVEKGYEGAILRNPAGKYLYGYRSYDLMKLKSFQDQEFKVVGVKEGEGKYTGCAVFVCQNDLEDNTFDCTMATELENKAEQFTNKDHYIGKWLTVKFQGRTDKKEDGTGQKPRFPVGKSFREVEELWA